MEVTKHIGRLFFLLVCSAILASVGLAAQPASQTPPQAAIATAHPVATAAGEEILRAGGNAFDAAVAISATLAVVEPYSSGLGGGGFWLLHRASDGKQVMIDGRERAPGKAHRDMYLDSQGEVIPGLSVNGPLAAGIPGEPAALVHIAEQYGRLPLSASLTPAIRAARQGFPVDAHYQRMAGFRLEVINRSAAAADILLDKGKVPALGSLIRQPDLAATLEAMAKQGYAGFYQGAVASKLVSAVQQAGGIWTREDLRNYRVVERKPITGSYKGYKITAAAPPSSGGIVLLTMLNILSGYDLEAMSEVQRLHVIIEAMRRAYRDRAVYMGDPDFVSMPVKRLTNLWYAAGLRAGISLDQATPSSALAPVPVVDRQGRHTTHFSVLDTQGNRVAATLSINYPFGSGFIAAGTGVLLNDEMDDFSSKPGTPNVYGLVGAQANAIAPGKRPLSSMTPAFIENDQGVAILGTPGGSRIITMVLLAALDYMKQGSARHMVNLPRFHHQYLPDVVQVEAGGFSDALHKALA
ncbi:MAG TPA: gamma-glutamyltransferase, partial [Gammaproteobacteria bacterium]|nr:gamma-glutamyltransferase [Gammaproteobacteria bacterium]